MDAVLDSDIDTNYEMKDVSDSAPTPRANGWTLLSCFLDQLPLTLTARTLAAKREPRTQSPTQ
jgi:hypothetical protein